MRLKHIQPPGQTRAGEPFVGPLVDFLARADAPNPQVSQCDATTTAKPHAA